MEAHSIVSHPKKPILLRAALLLTLGTVIVIHLQNPTGTIGDGSFLALGWAASIWAWLGTWRAPRSARLVPGLIAAGITAATVGDVILRIYTWTGRTPDVSLADIGWVGGYLALGAALLITLFRRQGDYRVNIDAVIDVLTIVTVSVLLFWDLSVEGIVTDTGISPLVRGVWAAYPVADAILLALVLRTIAGSRTRALMGLAFAGGVAAWLAADIGFLLNALSGTFLSSWPDVGWVLGALLMARSTWRRPDPAAVQPEADDRPAGHGLGKIGIAILPLSVPVVLELINHVRGRDGTPFDTDLAMAVLLTLAFVRTARLLRSEQRARADARKSHRHYACLAANSSDAVIVIAADGRVVNESPGLGALVGHEGPTRGVDPMRLLAPVDPDEVRALITRATLSPGEAFDTEVQVHHRRGTPVWLGARVVNLLHDPDVEGVIIALHDISGRKRAESELSHQAFHDALTGLPNRALYRDRVEHALARNARTGLDSAVLYLDLDGFKNVNDSLGHDAGDALLREVATRLLSSVRTGDTVARLGGDEFAILIEQSPRPLDEATAVADRVLTALAAPYDISGMRVLVSASVGIAGGDGDTSAAELVRNADMAMYRAKTTGKSQWITYDPHMREAAMERLQLETDLDGALERDEFRLVYQPVVRLESEQIVGFEALLRWHHPTLGVIVPDRFIPMAEESGSIVPIGEWVLRTACAMGAQWQRQYQQEPKLTMAVNVSARQLAENDLVEQVTGALASSALDPATLVLEMTETALIHDAPVAARRLHELRRLGVRLAIDDFGTGYSSLSYLRQFPVDILKIDRSFINTITDRAQIPAIVRGLLDLGRTLELETVAEGVEEGAQRDGLLDEHCQLAQGFLFARPLDPADAEALLLQMNADAKLVETA